MTKVDLPFETDSGGQGDAGRERRDALVDRWLDGAITPAELAEMEQQLLESSVARGEFWRRAALHGLLHEAARVAFAETPRESAPVGVGAVADAKEAMPLVTESAGFGRPAGGRHMADHLAALGRGRWFWPGALAAACLLLVGGVGIGSLLATLTVAHAGRVASEFAEPFPVLVEGFELPPAPLADYLPTATDCWSGDETRVVGREAWDDQRMLPHTGEHMLQFVSGHPRGESYAGVASEIWRFIDLEQMRALAGSREIRVELSAWFNGTPATDSTRRMCGLKAIATQHAPGQIDHSIWLKQVEGANPDAVDASARPVAAAETNQDLDGDPASWQRVAVVVAVPAHARYLLLHCYARGQAESAFASGECVAGQYIDDIVVTVQPEQSFRRRSAAIDLR
ncbi:MAG: hypothetical protein RLZZ111_1193 [Planctomycetota bacterium]|jgi:hypothetical protein